MDTLALTLGPVTLRAADSGALGDFYTRLLGLPSERTGDVVSVMGADRRPLLVLDSSASAGARPGLPRSTGLYHVAWLYPSRAALAHALKRLLASGGRLDGASDHGVSEALYLHDPEGNGIELYHDRPIDQWPREPDGSLAMFTEPLDVAALLSADADVDSPPVIGHVHLKVARIDPSLEFWAELLGLRVRQRLFDFAAFLADGDYHHHIGMNTWESRGGDPLPADRTGLDRVEMSVRREALERIAARLQSAGTEFATEDGALRVRDPNGIAVVIRAGD